MAANTDHEMAYITDGDQSRFLAEIDSLKDSIGQFNRNVKTITVLNTRSLSAVPSEKDPSHEDISRQLKDVTEETKGLSADIKERIRKLGEEDMTRLTKAQLATRKNMITFVRTQFMNALQDYQKAEQDYRAKSRERVERQYRIVNPDATPEEINQVVEGGQTQIFAQAMHGGRYDVGRTAYREVQVRHEDLKKLEQTLAELAQLFTDVAYLVQQQNDTFKRLEETTAQVEVEVMKGTEYTAKARDSAARARRARQYCFGITVLVILIIALVLGLYFGLR